MLPVDCVNRHCQQVIANIVETRSFERWRGERRLRIVRKFIPLLWKPNEIEIHFAVQIGVIENRRSVGSGRKVKKIADPYGQKTQPAENVVASVPELWIPGYFVNDLLRGVQSGNCQDTNRGGSIWNGLGS